MNLVEYILLFFKLLIRTLQLALDDLQTRLLYLTEEIESLKERKLANRLDQQIPHTHEAMVSHS